MISIDKLRAVTRLCTHASCPDGIASALIVKDALPNVRVSFMAYNTAELAALPAEPGLLFVDFTPPRERVAEFVAAGSVCLDHHPTARDIVEAFGENGVFGLNERNECGAWLAYEHVWRAVRAEQLAEAGCVGVWAPERNKVRDFAELAAIRDTWKKDAPQWREACEQAALLLFWPFEDLDIQSDIVLGSDLGRVLVNKQLSAAERSLDEAHRFTTTKGTRVVMFQGTSTTSDAAEIQEGRSDERDLVVGFHYRSEPCSSCGGGGDNDPSGEQGDSPLCPKCGGFGSALKLQFSTRSHTGYDCAAFAKSHPGGGGHKAAAGFTVEVSPELSANPYQVFRILLEEFENG